MTANTTNAANVAKALPGKYLAALFVAGLLSSAAVHAGQITYCCTTAQGRKACGDILPQECHGRAYRELNARGTLIRQVEAPLTAEQLAQRDAEAKRKKQAETAARDEQRRNQALLSTYATADEIDFVRDRALDQIGISTKNLQAKYNETLKRRQQLNTELASYQSNPAPKALKERIRANELDLQAQLAATEEKKREMEQVIKRFAEEKRRYIELRQSAGAAPISNTNTY